MNERRLKLLLGIVFTSTIMQGFTQTKQSEDDKPDFSKVKMLIEQAVANKTAPSLSIAVVHNGNTLWEESFGLADKEADVKATINTPYYLASITKTITATVIMQLTENKLVDINKPVNNYLGNEKVSSFLWNTADATVKKVMNHTAGLTTYNKGCHASENTGCPETTGQQIGKYGVVFWQPGDHFDYSNLGYGILGEVVAHASGESFAAYLSDSVFRPLGMDNSFLGTDLSQNGKAARYLQDSAKSRSADAISYTPGASSAYASIHDLTQFARLLLKDEIPDSKKIISNRSVDYMQNFVVPTGRVGEYYGLGCDVTKDFYGFKGVLAQGGTNDASAWMQLIPSENIAVIFLANTGLGDVFCHNIINEALAAVLPAFKQHWLAYKQPEQQKTSAHTVPSSWVGKWKGLIRAGKKDIPFELTITQHQKTFSSFDNGNPTPVGNIAFDNNRLFFNIQGNLEVSDVGTAPYDIGFELCRKSNFLYGALTAYGTSQLPFWVRLDKLQ